VPTPAPLEIKRHYSELSEKETADVVETVADLIVTFLKGRPESARRVELKQEQPHDKLTATCR
jgi:dihydroneopterin aldolase